MRDLVEILKASGLVTDAQIELTKQKQRVLGGSLTLHLLADGLVPEPAIQVVLDQLHGTDSLSVYRMEPEPEVLGLLTSEQAASLKAIPLRTDGEELIVLMVDPGDESARTRISELAGGRAIRAYPINELRFLWLLDKWYGVPCPAPFAKVVERLFDESALGPEDEEPGSQEDELIYDPMAGGSSGLGDMALFAAAPAGGPSGEEDEEIVPILESELPLLIIEEGIQSAEAERAEAPPLKLEDLDAELARVQSLDELYDLFVRFGRSAFTAMAAFKIQAGTVAAWRATGQGVDTERLDSFSAPVGTGILLSPATGKGLVILSNRAHPLDDQLASILGVQPGQVLVSDAVSVGGRPVLVLCGAVARDLSPDEVAVDFHAFCTKASEAVLRMILEKKKRRRGQ